jgi:hypothetical protein
MAGKGCQDLFGFFLAPQGTIEGEMTIRSHFVLTWHFVKLLGRPLFRAELSAIHRAAKLRAYRRPERRPEAR